MSIPHTKLSKITFSCYVSLFIGHKANNELLKLDLPAKAKVRLSLLQADLYYSSII